MVRSSPESIRRAAGIGIAGGLITAAGGAVVQLVVQPSTTVSDEMWSYPLSSDALVPISLLWALAHVLVAVGILGVRRSGVVGPSRAGRGGLLVALIGTALLFGGEIGSIPINEARADDSSAMMVGAFFGFGTLLSAVGFLLAGKAALSATTWQGWRRYALLVTGIWTTALLGLSFTKALPGGVAIYGLCLLAMCWALYTHPAPATGRPGPVSPARGRASALGGTRAAH